MSLDEEITLYQFAQGVQAEASLLDRFSQLKYDKKAGWFLDVSSQVRALKPIDADRQQAMTDSGLTDTDVDNVFPKANRLKIAIYTIMQHPEGDYAHAYKLLLYLFKAAYQRRVTSGNPARWRYVDLSSPDVVENIRTRHQHALEDVYANPGFRSEFASIAKLRHERYTLWKAEPQEPTPEPQTHFTFLSYDEMITESIKAFTDKQMRGIYILSHSLEKALSAQYGFDADEARRVIDEVVERHWRETYDTDLF